jgi:hypothetical protein
MFWSRLATRPLSGHCRWPRRLLVSLRMPCANTWLPWIMLSGTQAVGRIKEELYKHLIPDLEEPMVCTCGEASAADPDGDTADFRFGAQARPQGRCETSRTREAVVWMSTNTCEAETFQTHYAKLCASCRTSTTIGTWPGATSIV